jgi:predicted component of type VI protein secretion system
MSEDRKTWLVPAAGGAPIEVRKDIMLVGRQENCDLLLDHKTVSKLHCALVRTDNALLIRDLGSTNGCRINGQRLLRGALLADDVLSIAAFEYRVHVGASEPATKMGRGPDRTEVLDRKELMDGCRFASESAAEEI